jgi:hypothetical protein
MLIFFLSHLTFTEKSPRVNLGLCTTKVTGLHKNHTVLTTLRFQDFTPTSFWPPGLTLVKPTLRPGQAASETGRVGTGAFARPEKGAASPEGANENSEKPPDNRQGFAEA